MKTKFASRAALALLGLAAIPALAHHGWTYFDTSQVRFLEGQVVSVRWGNPHPIVVLRVTPMRAVPDLSAVRMPAEESGMFRNMPALPVPAGLRLLETDTPEYTVVLAPPSRLMDWGMGEKDAVPGSRFRMIGYLACDDKHEFRPEVVILDDNRAVRQRSVPVPPTACS
ncbi:DUF6152 family protein [Aeromonas caviae]|uniref:DUF6152 family protein n=1 Tax=Aeromonas caviae TaxID=648 RepID=UPI00244AD40F|nr:DUF6152 family protein [Aeromonas caviae]MDH0358218.1 DUF6152 family protein [Aeromonas caviae]